MEWLLKMLLFVDTKWLPAYTCQERSFLTTTRREKYKDDDDDAVADCWQT